MSMMMPEATVPVFVTEVVMVSAVPGAMGLGEPAVAPIEKLGVADARAGSRVRRPMRISAPRSGRCRVMFSSRVVGAAWIADPLPQWCREQNGCHRPGPVLARSQ